jgi:hypothetical protein
MEGSITKPAWYSPAVSLRRVVRMWTPLAGSWLLMGLELPLVSAVMARLPRPEVSLAAYGGVVFPLSMIVEAPIIMLLSASTALSRDWPSYLLVRRFMLRAGAILTVIHALVAFTPLYDLVVGGLIHPPAEVLGPARIGLMIMLPWTWSIAYRRFQQGVLIRFGRPHYVGIGTVVRLSTNVLVLILGYALGTVPGIVVAASAVAVGVVSEAIFIGVVTRPVVRRRLRAAPEVSPALTWPAFRSFYVPLALTSLLALAGAPIVSAALSRMPRALDSLAVWSVINGLVFILRGLGMALNEVVVALLEEPGAARNLRRFALLLGTGASSVLAVVAFSPLARFYFGTFSGLSSGLTTLASSGIRIAVLMPALGAAQSWFQGQIVHSRRTRGITEAVGVYLVVSFLILVGGILWHRGTGLYIGLAAVFLGTLLQSAWLWKRSRDARRLTAALRDGSDRG